MDRREQINTLRGVFSRLVPISQLMGAETTIVCCPFHDDRNPSAKMYEDGDGERLFCFYCFVAGTQISIKEGVIPIEVIVDLVKQGVEVKVRTPRGLHAVTYAKSQGKKKVVKLTLAKNDQFKGTLTGSLDHPILVMRGEKLLLIQMGDAMVGDSMLEPSDSLAVKDSDLWRLWDGKTSP